MSSRSNFTELENPCTRWFQWSGSEGTLSYYDKEKKENIPVTLPFRFMWLTSLHTVKGYAKGKGGVYSNEIVDLDNHHLNVRINKESIALGLWKNVKDIVTSSANGGKYAQSTYIAYKDESGELKIGNIMFMGSSFAGGTHVIDKKSKNEIELEGWMMFLKKNRLAISKGAVEISLEERECTNGATKYRIPKFKIIALDPKTNESAMTLDRQLQEYLTAYLSKTQSEIPQHTEVSKEEQTHNDTIARNRAAVDAMAPLDNGEDFGPFGKEEETGAVDNNVDNLPF
jgi:hypothetical protein